MFPAQSPTTLRSEPASDGIQVNASVETPEQCKQEKKQPKIVAEAKWSTIAQLVKKLPRWVMKIKDRRQQKLLFRYWLVSWLMVVVLLPTNSLHILGQATYGGNMALKDFTISAYHGVFLDSCSTAVFGVFLATGTFSLGYLRAKKPQFALPAVFATIFLDVLCSSGPLFPTPQYSLLNSFVISTGYYIAAAMLVIIFVFPQTLNHEWIYGAVKLLGDVDEFMALQEEVLNVELDELDMDPMSDCLLNRMHGKADSLNTQFLACELSRRLDEPAPRVLTGQQVCSKTTMLRSEVSYGQLSADDLTRFELPLRNVVTRTSGLMAFLTLLVSHVNTRRRDAKSGVNTPISKSLHKNNNFHIRDTFRLIQTRRLAAQHEIHQRLRIEDLMPTLRSTTEDLRKACMDAAKAASKALTVINTQRYKQKLPWLSKKLRRIEEEEVLDTAATLEYLHTAIHAYKHTNRFELLQPFSSLIDSDNASPLVDEHGHPPFSLRTLFLCFVFQSNLLWAAEALKSLLALVLEAEKKRPDGQLWWPTHVNRILTFILRDSGTSPLDSAWAPLDIPPAEEDGHEYFAHGYQRDPDSRPPKHFGQKIGQTVHYVRVWMVSPETIFAFKYMTIRFTYTEKGLWALFMGQLTLALYISDQVQAVKGRIIGTLQGALVGMVAWYVGNGGGHHLNPYGLAASSGLFLIPVVFNRLFNPHPIDSMVCGVTAMLVIGYSCINAHLDPLGNPGVGWNVAWRRTVCVFIGCGGALVLMLFPPQSRRRDIRLSTAATLEDISGLYAGLLSRWLGDVEHPNTQVAMVYGSDVEGPNMMSDSEAAKEILGSHVSFDSFERWAPVFRSRVIKVSARLRALQYQTDGAKWEGNLRGDWPIDKYARLVAVQSRMVMNLVQLSASLGALSPTWRKTLLHKTPVLNPNLVTDTMSAFAIFAMSLKTGRAISEVLPRSLVDRVYYHQSLTAQREEDEDEEEIENNETCFHTSTAFTCRHKRTPRQHHQVLTKETFMSEEWGFYATGLAAAFQILFALDEARGLCADLCGEVPLRGFEDWRREFELRQLGERV
ncbi:hypothetical protein FRB96_005033 [Tulasnella sp. 330]|nr:hypothetical protein FRB96_005033 [Tulasnella sp. 330]